MEKKRITAVSYLNTLPFVYGLRKLDPAIFELSLDVPSVCAQKVLSGEADFGLTPVVVLPSIDRDYDMMDFGIASDDEVCTVLLLSRKPVNEISSILLDGDSRTSVLLVRLLCRHYWNISPEWIEHCGPDNFSSAESMLVIGDKSIELQNEYEYRYDLAQAWRDLTGLPFVFAVWVAKTNAGLCLRNEVMNALQYGMDHTAEAISEFALSHQTKLNLNDYFSRCIKLKLDVKQKEGLSCFLKMAGSIE